MDKDKEWRLSTTYVDSADKGRLYIFADGAPVAAVLPPALVYTRHADTEARAALIVRAVNERDDLIAALRMHMQMSGSVRTREAAAVKALDKAGALTDSEKAYYRAEA